MKRRRIRRMRYNVVMCNLPGYFYAGGVDTTIATKIRYRKAVKLAKANSDHVNATWIVLVRREK